MMILKTGNKEYQIKVAKSFKTRLIGLMGQKNINYGLLFPNCNSIHTYFMKENIDIVGLNENNEVIYKYENLPKKRALKIGNPQKKTSILELPKNASKKIKLGSILLFEDKEII